MLSIVSTKIDSFDSPIDIMTEFLGPLVSIDYTIATSLLGHLQE